MSATAALRARGCQCPTPIVDSSGECAHCGREVRQPSNLARELRRLLYQRELERGLWAGLCPREGFRGLRDELPTNPPTEAVREAVRHRVETQEASGLLVAA